MDFISLCVLKTYEFMIMCYVYDGQVLLLHTEETVIVYIFHCFFLSSFQNYNRHKLVKKTKNKILSALTTVYS